MSLQRIGALLGKDLSLFFKNRFIALITLLGVVFFIIIYFIMPRSVDETLEIGFYAPGAAAFLKEVKGDGFTLNSMDSEEELRQAVLDGDYIAGVSVPRAAVGALMAGKKMEITLYVPSDIPDEVLDSLEVLLEAQLSAGYSSPLEIKEEVLGTDLMGMQIPPRNRLRPLLAVVIVLFEIMGLANLISEEAEKRTLHALLVTPVTPAELFVAKGITGVALAFSQAVLFAAVAGALAVNPLIILVTLLLGSIMATGLAFIAGSFSKDFMGVIVWGMITMIIMMVPAFSVVFPGSMTGWIKAVPAFYLVDTVHRVSNYGAGWGDSWRNLVILVGWDSLFIGIGIWALQRKSRNVGVR
jgi:ABC-2 type transport system permease protein